jgi:FAD/FMN-containing dehydrogenase
MTSITPTPLVIPPGVLVDLRAAVDERGWIDEPSALDPYLHEERGLFRGSCAAVLRPRTTGEVARIVSICAAAGVPVVPQGGNTGLVGGAVPHGGIVVSTDRINRIRDVDPVNRTITVEAGVILSDVQKAADDADLLFPLSLAAEGSCRIGGNLATNAGGTAVLRYGNARDLVLGVEVVLADGRIWNGLNGLRKNNTGYDLKHLFIGSEGTLGIITAAVLKLFPKPKVSDVALAGFAAPQQGIELFQRANALLGDALTGFELFSRRCMEFCVAHVAGNEDPFGEPHGCYALIKLTSPRRDEGLREALETLLAEAFEGGIVEDATIAASEGQAQALWRIRESIPEAQKSEGCSIKNDVSVPVSQVPAFIETASRAVEAAIPGIRVVAFGHVGDGNIHFNLSQPVGAERNAFIEQWPRIEEIVGDIAAGLGGSFAAEHGIGELKLHGLDRYKPPVEIEMMRAIKLALDPRNIMNPGKILAPPAGAASVTTPPLPSPPPDS